MGRLELPPRTAYVKKGRNPTFLPPWLAADFFAAVKNNVFRKKTPGFGSGWSVPCVFN